MHVKQKYAGLSPEHRPIHFNLFYGVYEQIKIDNFDWKMVMIV
jgi:hypothetical protein